jgi:hypothetical protein
MWQQAAHRLNRLRHERPNNSLPAPRWFGDGRNGVCLDSTPEHCSLQGGLKNDERLSNRLVADARGS